MRPLLFHLGVVIALSLAGYLSFRIRPSRPPPRLKDEICIPPNLSPSSDLGLNKIEGLSSIINSSTSAATTTVASPSSKSSGNDDGFLLSEFSQLILNEFEESKREQEKILAMEHEIDYLRNLVDYLQERERTLEIELLGYHRLKEQSGAVRELKNRLKVSATEARVLSLKVEALQGENDQLREQALGYLRAVAEMESVRAKFRVLQKKLRSDGEQAEEKIADVQQRRR